MTHIGLGIVGLVLLGLGESAQRPGRQPPLLEPGRPVQTQVSVTGVAGKSFRVRVPEDAVMLEVRVSGAAADLDVFLRHDQAMENPDEDADYAAATSAFNETIRVARWHDPPLSGGTYFVQVRAGSDRRPMIGKRRANSIPLELNVEIVRATIEESLKPGEPMTTDTSRRTGFMRIFAIEVPQEAKCLRLDLAEVTGDLDLFARRGVPAFDLDDADYEASGIQSRESLVIDAQSDPPIEPGKYFVSVVNALEDELPVEFTIHASFATAPPAALLAIPPLPEGRDAMERALYATAELITPGGGGSGTILTASGLILTNAHVLHDIDDKPVRDGDVIVAMTFDVHTPPTELFRARIVKSDEELDLALVEIVSGFYGQPLPDGYRFRPLPLGDPAKLHLGDSIWTMGYPRIGGTRSRPTITVKRGIVSGFERYRAGSLIKTDAQLLSGDSGGAALNAQFELVGVPSDATQEDPEFGTGQLGFVRALSLLPPDWRKLIDGRHGK